MRRSGMTDCDSGRSGCANGWRNIRARAAGCGRAEVEAAYRFFSNAKVTAARVLGPHHDASLRRLAAHPVVLCVQDTTELDFTGKQTTGLGPLNYAATRSVSPCHHCTDAAAAGSWH